MPLPILKGLGINNIGLPQTGAFSLEAMRNQSNVPADTLGLIAGVLYSGAKDKEDIKKVATTIANRAKESKITPLQVITKGYTEVGEDSGAKFKPFLAGDYSRGGQDVADESYRIARELFSGTFVPVGTFNSMVANPNTGANDYYYQNLGKNYYKDVDNEFLPNKYAKPSTEMLTEFEPPIFKAPSAPQAGVDINPLKIAQSIQQGIMRSGAAIGLTLTNKPELPEYPE